MGFGDQWNEYIFLIGVSIGDHSQTTALPTSIHEPPICTLMGVTAPNLKYQYVLCHKYVDDFEIEHKTCYFWSGVQYPLNDVSQITNFTPLVETHCAKTNQTGKLKFVRKHHFFPQKHLTSQSGKIRPIKTFLWNRNKANHMVDPLGLCNNLPLSLFSV